MKKNVHPQYYPDAQIVCACGNRATTGSTKQSIHVELCDKCHPFYTGQQRFVDKKGQIDRFVAARDKAAKIAIAKPTKKKKNEEKKEEWRPRTIKEMLEMERKNQK